MSDHQRLKHDVVFASLQHLMELLTCAEKDADELSRRGYRLLMATIEAYDRERLAQERRLRPTSEPGA